MEYNPFLPEVRDNPYPYYAYLREHAPVYQVPDFGWMISRYDDVLSVLRNPRVFSSVNLLGSMGDLNPFPPAAPPLEWERSTRPHAAAEIGQPRLYPTAHCQFGDPFARDYPATP